jgi:hypothetical protein
MTWIQLKEPPQDAVDYIGSPEKSEPGGTEWNIRELMKKGVPKIAAINFDVETIKNLETEIVKNGYKIQVVLNMDPRLGHCADFYLLKA